MPHVGEIGAGPAVKTRGELSDPKPSQSVATPAPPRQQWLGNLILLAFSIVLSLSLAETFLRIYFPYGDTTLELDARYLHRFKPNTRQLYWLSAANGGKRSIVSINKEGRRGDVVSMDRPRVMVYGDSFVASMASPVHDTFVWQLQEKLKGSLVPGPQTVNCGVPGYGPDQESLLLADEIDRLKPQLILVSIYAGNDFGDLLRDKIYRLDAHQSLADNPHSFAPSLIYSFGEPDRLPRLYTLRLLGKFWQRLTHHDSPAKPLTSDAYMEEALRESRAEYDEFVLQGDNSVRNLLVDHYDADISLTPGSDSARYKRLLMDRVIEKMKRTADSRSIPFMLVIVPAPFDVVDNYAITVNPQKYLEYRRSAISDAVEEIARTHDIPYVNLFKPFHEHDPASLYYAGDNDHWNSAGQDFAAGLVADYIKQHRLLDAPSSAGSPPK